MPILPILPFRFTRTVPPPARLTRPFGTEGDVSALAGCRVMVVEDEVLPAMEMEIALEEAEADVVGPAHTLGDALGLLDAEAEPIDVAILDVDLHGRDVYPVAEALRARGVPFLFYTGHGTREDLQARFGAVTVCAKPMLMEALLARVARMIGGGGGPATH